MFPQEIFNLAYQQTLERVHNMQEHIRTNQEYIPPGTRVFVKVDRYLEIVTPGGTKIENDMDIDTIRGIIAVEVRSSYVLFSLTALPDPSNSKHIRVLYRTKKPREWPSSSEVCGA